MKTTLAFLLFVIPASAQAGTCDLVSGFFTPTAAACRYSHDGVRFFNEVGKDIKITYSEQNHTLAIVMNVSAGSGAYNLNYITDGKEQLGRPMYEGELYTASCENNHVLIRAEMSALKYPLIHDYVVGVDGKLTYQESFEGDSFVRICEMERK